MALSGAERAKRYRERRETGDKIVQYRRPSGRRSKLQKWNDGLDTLMSVLDDYQEWRDNMPAGLAETPTAALLDAVLELRELVEQLQAAELPKGFGRD